MAGDVVEIVLQDEVARGVPGAAAKLSAYRTSKAPAQPIAGPVGPAPPAGANGTAPAPPAGQASYFGPGMDVAGPAPPGVTPKGPLGPAGLLGPPGPYDDPNDPRPDFARIGPYDPYDDPNIRRPEGIVTLDPVNVDVSTARGGGGGMPPRETPPGLFAGGYLFPGSLEEARTELELAILQAPTAEEAARLKEYDKRLPDIYRRWNESEFGQGIGLMRRQAAGEEERGYLEAGHQDYMAERHAERADEMQQLQASQEQEYKQHRQRLDALASRRDQEMGRYEEAVKSLTEPALNGSETALAAVALFLGALGSSMAKTPNWAMEQIEKEKDRRMRGREATVSARGNMLHELRGQLGDERAAHAAMEAHLYKSFDMWQQEWAGRNGSELAKTNSAILSSKIAEKVELVTREQKLIATQAALAEERQRQAMAAAHANAQAQQARREAMGGYVPLQKDEQGRVIFGWGIAGPGMQDAKLSELRDKAADLATYNQNMQRLIQLADKGLAGKLSPQDRTEIAQLRGFIETPIYKEYAGASQTPAEQQNIGRMFGPDGFTADVLGTVVPALQRHYEITNRTFGNRLHAYGVRPADVVAGQDPKDPDRVIYYRREGGPPQQGGATLSAGAAPQ